MPFAPLYHRACSSSKFEHATYCVTSRTPEWARIAKSKRESIRAASTSAELTAQDSFTAASCRFVTQTLPRGTYGIIIDIDIPRATLELILH